MTRTFAREIALGCIFEYVSGNVSMKEILETRFNSIVNKLLADEDKIYDSELDTKSQVYIDSVCHSVETSFSELMDTISDYSKGWKIDRISVMTKSILLLSMTELLYIDRHEVPLKVSVNEAVNLAKKYDAEKSSTYINGILGEFIRNSGLQE